MNSTHKFQAIIAARTPTFIPEGASSGTMVRAERRSSVLESAATRLSLAIGQGSLGTRFPGREGW